MTKKSNLAAVLLFTFAAAIGLDQWTKWLAITHLKEKPPFIVMEGVFEFWYSENRGAAFGMLQGRQGFFFIIAVAVMAVVCFLIVKLPCEKRYFPLAFTATFIAAGAAGNLIDRVTHGFVVDFLYFKLINFPIFNVADCYVTVSTFLLFLLIMFRYQEQELEMLFIKKGETKDAADR